MENGITSDKVSSFIRQLRKQGFVELVGNKNPPTPPFLKGGMNGTI
jgi:hypothetical protein